MHDSRRRDPPLRRRRHWCCSFTIPPLSPDNPALSNPHASSSCSKKTDASYSSPQTHQHQKPTPLARRILSPGRVSPISDPPVPAPSIPQKQTLPKSPLPPAAVDSEIVTEDEGNFGDFDVRLNLKGKNGGSLILELGSEVLAANSVVFADLVADYRKNSSGLCRIEVPGVENLNVFRETIELMFEEDISKKLLKVGAFRAIDILEMCAVGKSLHTMDRKQTKVTAERLGLFCHGSFCIEVAAGIKFRRCISSCLIYLEAVPWAEEEDDKLRELFNKINIDDAKTTDILDRLFSLNSIDSQPTLTKQLIQSVTSSSDANARNKLKSLVKGLLCKSSIYDKSNPDLNKEDVFAVCHSCLGSLGSLLEEASSTDTNQKIAKKEKDKPLLERISTQVDNLNWLLDILLDHQMAEDFVDLWANQELLLEMHENASPMVRYELSRVSGTLFIAMGTRRLHCPSETRLGLLRSWLRPMLSDFGWLQRCKKGLDMKALEEAMGQALLTLPLKEQCSLFMDWFNYFSKNGNECPNLSKAFQIWWRRSFLRGSETFGIESR
ncbi:BTB/POZ domain-containing protein at2g13690 [Phtheirospermum japonicum]|uniref:BTB/POZ domain-containing protein at2g13690 n=1 Tax=Phtheirospermum japonicum TaxID=374723 RepID=A0A830CIS0_9LAMI|nr:BTB/POZ domain-containing protein at2g13690 [Phtheirospermum japonicum]